MDDQGLMPLETTGGHGFQRYFLLIYCTLFINELYKKTTSQNAPGGVKLVVLVRAFLYNLVEEIQDGLRI